MDAFAPYGHALVSLAIVAVFGLVLSPLSAIRKQAMGLAPGEDPAADYASPAYRFHRAYVNLTENYGFFAGATLAAILAGASAFWVNLLAVIFLISRLVVAFVHIRGIGTPNAGPRTLVYVLGWLASILLGGLAVFAVFSA